jgi:hypothetical protein
MTRSLRFLAVVASACMLAGCGSESVTAAVPTMASIAGAYNLKTYNGVPVPTVIQPVNPKVEVLSDQVVVKSDGTWSEAGEFRVTDQSGIFTQQETGSGTYTLTGSVLTFKDTNGVVTSATLNGSSFTIVDGGQTLVYTR